MKTISLWQPHGSLLFILNHTTGRPFKLHETRHWAPPTRLIGQCIGIHAAKNTADLEGLQDYIRDRNAGGPEFACEEAFRVALRRRFEKLVDIPRGCLLGTAVLVAAHRTESRPMVEWGHFGNFSPGRWAWELGDVRALPEPVLWRGAQGFFDVPDEAFATAVGIAG